jgi:hypothetical protein
MAITDNTYRVLLKHSTQTIELHTLYGKPFLTNEKIALVISFTTHRIASTKKNNSQTFNHSWQDAEEAYSFNVL